MTPASPNEQMTQDQQLTCDAADPRRDRQARPGLLSHLFGRRRNYLIDPAYQLRTAIVAVLGMTFVVGVAAGLLHLLRTERVAPLLEEVPLVARGLASDTRWAVFLVVAGVVLVGAVFVIEILETHKTAGVVLRVSRGLHGLRTGSWGTLIALRKYDNFRELEEAFNCTARALCSRAEDDLRNFATLEERLDLMVREMEAGNGAGGTELLRQLKGDLAALCDRRRDLLRAAPDVQFEPKI
jgi:hypothetical protein